MGGRRLGCMPQSRDAFFQLTEMRDSRRLACCRLLERRSRPNESPSLSGDEIVVFLWRFAVLVAEALAMGGEGERGGQEGSGETRRGGMRAPMAQLIPCSK